MAEAAKVGVAIELRPVIAAPEPTVEGVPGFTDAASDETALPANEGEAELAKHLDANTDALDKAFAQKDGEAEKRLYVERHEILLKLRALRPRSTEPPIVEKGIVDFINIRPHRGLRVRTSPDRQISISAEDVNDLALRKRFAQIKEGDHVELTFTMESSLYFPKRYYRELSDVQVKPATPVNQE